MHNVMSCHVHVHNNYGDNTMYMYVNKIDKHIVKNDGFRGSVLKIKIPAYEVSSRVDFRQSGHLNSV